jgi:hypothetical protein
VSATGEVAHCMRIENGKAPMKNGGWIHRLLGESIRRAPWTSPPEVGPLHKIDAEALAVRYRNDLSPGKLAELSVTLNVSREALTCLGVGWDGEAWTFPMQDAAFFMVGIRRRLPSGKKLSVKGGHEGCFIPLGTPSDLGTTLIVCEGPTDTAAIIDAGFEAIGRPSCAGGREIVKALSRKRDVVIIADSDGPGREGAKVLANELVAARRYVKVIEPLRGKDARAWHPSRAVLQNVIDNAYPWRATP